jgi:hypothetical protein
MSEYPATITKALHDIMAKVSYVQKGGLNKFHNYKYAGEADLLEVLRPAMLEAGLLLLPSGVEQSSVDQYGNTQISVAYTLAHKDGDVWPDKLIAFGCGNDKNKQGGVGDKGTYKALTGANKYLLFKLFQIETGDDPERAEHDPPSLPPADLTPESDQRMADNIGKIMSKPAMIVVPNIDDEAAKWAAWAKSMMASINASQSPNDVDQWISKNGVPLGNLKLYSEKAYGYIQEQSELKKTTLMTGAG